jgi:hypothetical protein
MIKPNNRQLVGSGLIEKIISLGFNPYDYEQNFAFYSNTIEGITLASIITSILNKDLIIGFNKKKYILSNDEIKSNFNSLENDLNGYNSLISYDLLSYPHAIYFANKYNKKFYSFKINQDNIFEILINFFNDCNGYSVSLKKEINLLELNSKRNIIEVQLNDDEFVSNSKIKNNCNPDDFITSVSLYGKIENALLKNG